VRSRARRPFRVDRARAKLGAAKESRFRSHLLSRHSPHLHLRGKQFDYNILHPDGSIETLLHVHYNFYWQLSYRLAASMWRFLLISRRVTTS